MIPCYIFDIDGTLADGDHRVHHIRKTPKDWDTYFSLCGDDLPIAPVIQLAQTLHRAGEKIFYFSGRAAQSRDATEAWLQKHSLPPAPLFMRAPGDYRDDDILKSEFLDNIIDIGFMPVMAFDDRNRVVAMWRKRGIICAQVAEGDF